MVDKITMLKIPLYNNITISSKESPIIAVIYLPARPASHLESGIFAFAQAGHLYFRGASVPRMVRIFGIVKHKLTKQWWVVKRNLPYFNIFKTGGQR